MSKGKVITGVLIAAAAGAAIGILFAPDKGSKTRKKMMKKKEHFKDALQEKIADFVDQIAEQYENVKGGASDLIESGKAKAAAIKHSLS